MTASVGDKLYPFALACFFVVSAFLAYLAWISRADDVSRYEKIPRYRLWGTVLGGAALVWCSFEARPLVSESMHNFLVPAAFLLTWAGYLFLDYIFARALGGMLILISHYFLFESFAMKTPFCPVPEILFFASGTFGILICGKPHLLRDLIRETCRSRRWKIAVTGLMTAGAAVYLACSLSHLIGRQ